MVFKINSFEKIVESIFEHVSQLCKNHKVSQYEQLAEYRRQPVQFIYTVIDELKLEYSKEPKYLTYSKKMELAGFRVFALGAIALITVAMINSSGSYLSKSLLSSIGISDENKLDSTTAETMLMEGIRFIEDRIFARDDLKTTMIENHVFLTNNKNFNIDGYYEKGVDMLANFSKEKYREAKNKLTAEIQAHQEAERLAKNKDAPSFLSSFLPSSIWGAPPKKVEFLEEGVKKETEKEELVTSAACK